MRLVYRSFSVFSLLLISSSLSLAQTNLIEDFVSSIVTVSESSPQDFDSCADQICELANQPTGTGKCDRFSIIGVVAVDLSASASKKVAALTCVEAVEEDGIVTGSPRTGRSNGIVLPQE